MTDFVLGPNQTKWIEALESGKYDQTMHYLRAENYEDGDGEIHNGYCCLGVACELFSTSPVEILSKSIYSWDGEDAVATQEVIGKLNLFSPCGACYNADTTNPDFIDLTELNDNGWTFKQIAQHLRTYPQYYFKESK